MINPIQSQQDLLNQFGQLEQIARNDRVSITSNDSGIGEEFSTVMRSINEQQNFSSQMMAAVDAGRSDDVVGAMVASQKASLSFAMLMQVRNKVMNGFDDIMRMSL